MPDNYFSVNSFILGEGDRTWIHPFLQDRLTRLYYYVGLSGIILPEYDQNMIRQAVLSLLPSAIDEGYSIGIWECPESGTVYVDLVQIVFRRDTALSLARDKKQIAVYSSQGEVIRVE